MASSRASNRSARPSGGFSACGTSGGNGVSPFTSRRTRIASPGLKKCTFSDAIAGVICRSGDMSSSIQKLRPYVPTTRSLSLIAMSRYEVLGRFSMSDCQSSPSLNETYIELSVPAKSRPAFFVSARITRAKLPLGWSVARPFTIFVHVLPKSFVR